ncbi:MAG: ferredoxin family protein [Blastochloris sp.]|nr:ferredoxin family protein [Blastochloris sp.]
MVKGDVVTTKHHPLPVIDTQRCTGCGICVAGCPTKTIALHNERAVIAHPDACTFCELCEINCPEQAIGRPFRVVFATGTDTTKPAHDSDETTH